MILVASIVVYQLKAPPAASTSIGIPILSPNCSISEFPVNEPGKAVIDNPSPLAFAPICKTWKSFLLPGFMLDLAVATIWRVNQQMECLYFSVSLSFCLL